MDSAFWANRYAVPMFGTPIGPWHEWFAWKPVRSFDGRFLFLQKIMRRRCQLHEYLDQSAGSRTWWQFATKEPTTPTRVDDA